MTSFALSLQSKTQTCPYPLEDVHSYLIHSSLGRPECLSKMACRWVCCFCTGCPIALQCTATFPNFCSWWPWPLSPTFKLIWMREQTLFQAVNLAQIRSAIPEIFHTQTKKVTGSTKNKTLQSSLHAVISWNTGLKLKWTVTVQPENCIVEKSIHDMKLESPARGLRLSPPACTASLVVGSSKGPWHWPWPWIGSRSHQRTQYM